MKKLSTLLPSCAPKEKYPMLMRTTCTTYFYCACLAVLCLFTATSVTAQKKDYPLTFAKERFTLSELFKEIEKQTGLSPFYNSKEIDQSQSIMISPLKTSLSQVRVKLASIGIESIITKHSLVIRKTTNDSSVTGAKNSSNYPTNTESINLKNDTTLDRFSIAGFIFDQSGAPLPGASAFIAGTNHGAIADEKGKFVLNDVPANAAVTARLIGYEQQQLIAQGHLLTFHLKQAVSDLDEVQVSTGYQKIPKERATGSFDFVDNGQYNRAVSSDVLSRLDGITPGVLFNTNRTGNDPAISIRGRSTIYANTDPLIVVDNFPYDGDLNSINPNDVANVTILKDAAAASIWGVRAGNGVIVITTKKGRNNQVPMVSFNANVTVSPKPNLWSTPQMSSSDFIQTEKFLFQNGYYDDNINFYPYLIESPVIDILSKQRNNELTNEQATTLIDSMSKIDSRTDQSKYTLRPAVIQQYNISVNGGGAHNQYYLSAGYDNNLSSRIPSQSNRTTLDVKNSFQFLKDRLDISTDLYFSKSKSSSNSYSYVNASYPYIRLKDDNGKNAPVYQSWRNDYKNDLYPNYLLNWNYIPLDELHNKDATNNTSEYKLNFSASYKITNDLSIAASYQYLNGRYLVENDKDKNSYYVRDLVNQFTQVDTDNNIVTRPIPIGNILYKSTSDYTSQYGRAQLNYNHSFKTSELTALLGFEARAFSQTESNFTQFGYDPSTATSINVDYTTQFPNLISGQYLFVPGATQSSFSNDNTISYYANASYRLYNKYTLSASARKDESNIFGVSANQKGVPLWSIGLAWDISRENIFSKTETFPDLKIRITRGYNGNVIKTLSAYTTANKESGYYNSFQQFFEYVVNPPNPSLSWERVKITNIGIDLTTKNKVLTTSLDLYQKKGIDLIGNSQIAPQTGVTQFTGNTSSVLTNGIDLIATTRNINRRFSWTTTFILSYAKDKIIDSRINQGSNSLYLLQNYANPMEGKPYSAIFSYPSAGLDKLGNPQGYFDGKITTDYVAVENSTDISQLKYNGPATPTLFGSLMNTFSYANINLSFLLSYKLGYYFRRGSYVLSGYNYQMADYGKRWQQPGDENKTIVPSVIYPMDGNRDAFFLGSSDLVEKGDNIKLKDIQLSYSLNKTPLGHLEFYGYINNINKILWRKNKQNIDPDFVSNGYYSIKLPASFSLGFKLTL